MKVRLLSPSGVLFEGEASSLYVPSLKGPLGVLEGYTSVIEPLAEEGLIAVNDGKARRFFVSRGGVLEVKPGEAMILAGEIKEYSSEEEARKSLEEERR